MTANRRGDRCDGRTAAAEPGHPVTVPSTTVFARAFDHELRQQGIRCTNVCPGVVATDFGLEEGRGRTPEALPGMMSAEDVAEAVVFILERPRHVRIFETALRPMKEESWA